MSTIDRLFNMNAPIQHRTWQQIKPYFKAVNPTFYKIVNEINPSDNLPLLHVTYAYGASIVEEGKVQFPLSSSKTAPLSHTEFSHLSSDLNYAAIPLGFLANRTSEVFVTTENRTIPIKLLHPGEFFGIFDLANSLYGITHHPIWCVSSGVRTIFMLPSIAENASHAKLVRTFKLPFDVPKDLGEQWTVFKYLTNQDSLNERWCSDVIFLTTPWYEKLKNPPNSQWKSLAYYLLQEAWKHLQYSQNDTMFNLLWQKFSERIAKRHLKPRPYLINTIKHLINIANGIMPGFRPASDNEAIAPLNTIRTIYKDIYGLKRYAPTLMYPENLMNQQQGILYYSLSFPTLLGDSYLITRNTPNIISDERDIKMLIEMFCDVVRQSALSSDNPLQNTQFEFYHTEADTYGQILSSNQLFNNDPNFQYDLTHFSDKQLCINSVFSRGCIKIIRESI